MTRYTVQMVNGTGQTDMVEVEISEISEATAMRQAEFESATCSLAAWHTSRWRAVSAQRAPGAWMWRAT